VRPLQDEIRGVSRLPEHSHNERTRYLTNEAPSSISYLPWHPARVQVFLENVTTLIATILGFVNLFIVSSFLANGSTENMRHRRVGAGLLSRLRYDFGNRRASQHVPVLQQRQSWTAGAMLE